MNDTLFEELLALRHKRPLTSAEQARLESWLAAHPSDRARWDSEAALCAALRRLPQPVASSNFMARVWQDIEADERRSASAEHSRWTWFRWPSPAQQFALAVVLLAAVVAVRGRHARSPAQVARSIEQVATIARPPSVALLKDFEAISRLNQSAADVELLAALEQLR